MTKDEEGVLRGALFVIEKLLGGDESRIIKTKARNTAHEIRYLLKKDAKLLTPFAKLPGVNDDVHL